MVRDLLAGNVLGSKGRHNEAALLDLTQSRFTCRGDSAETRQCVFYNVIVKEGAIWLYPQRPFNRDIATDVLDGQYTRPISYPVPSPCNHGRGGVCQAAGQSLQHTAF